ncbi:sensor histidine kinase [Lysobacter cavernae]|uniref:Sensor histidine kinase n=1 Tax=Lysobacter cavernae TaxID=1685901 RepID=A0ABV7RUR9_9GAMM
MTHFVFIARLAVAWFVALIVLMIVINSTPLGNFDTWPVFLFGLITIGIVVAGAVSHLRRVRLLTGSADPAVLGNRQRRQIEIPFEAGEAFDLVDAAIRELPGTRDIESARDSLQVRARVERRDPYRGVSQLTGDWSWFRNRGNQISAIVSPGDGTGSVTLLCEPDSGVWSDWFMVDDGTNLENAEAITRAIARRIAERRRSEQAAVAQTQTEKELTVAKLSLLHAQVEPHFLYNTLASAQILTRADPARADEMLGHLIQFLRHSLPRTDEAMSTLGAELERSRAYLEILKLRMGPRLDLQIDVPDDLRATPLPPMMLQTLVENAIKHGLEPKTVGGTVWILARSNDRIVSVTVADDGQGFNAESTGTGIGLRNVRERLRLVYGEAAALAIVANFPHGVAATITVPVEGPQTRERRNG